MESKHLWDSALVIFLLVLVFVVIFASPAPAFETSRLTPLLEQYQESWPTTERRLPCPQTWETVGMPPIRRTSVRWAAALRTSQLLMDSISPTIRMQSAR